MFNLGLLLRESARLEPAIELLARAAEHAPGDGDVVGAYGSALAEAERWPEAHRWLEIAHRLTPNDPVLRFNLAQSSQRLQQPQEAVALLRALVEQIPGDPESWTVLGAALNDVGEFDEALGALEKALSLDPNAADARNELGNLYLDAGRFLEAAAEFRGALALKPTLTGAIWNLSRTRKYSVDERDDIELFERTLRRTDLPDAKRAEVHFALGKVYEDCSEYDSAGSHYENANALRAKRGAYDPIARADEVERIVSLCTPARLGELATLGSSSEQPIFIVGMPRSGTSLVEQVISSHSQASGAGELADIPRWIANLEEQLGGRYPEFLSALDKPRVTQVAAAYLDALGTHGEASSVRITDKLPGNFNFLGLIGTLFPRARIVHCRRSPMDVGMSLFTRPFTDGHEYSYRLSDIAAEFRAYERLMAHWTSAAPLVFHEVEYEAMISEPEREMRRLIDFCGLAWERQCMEFHRSERRVRTASQWQVRQPIYATSIERWRRFGPLGEELERQLSIPAA